MNNLLLLLLLLTTSLIYAYESDGYVGLYNHVKENLKSIQ